MCKLAEDGYRVTSVQSQASNPLITKQKQLGIEHIWLEFTMKEFLRIAYNLGDAQTDYAQAQPDLIIFSDDFCRWLTLQLNKLRSSKIYRT